VRSSSGNAAHTGETELAAIASGGRVGALDGLRGLSVLLVLAFHSNITGFAGGFVGVSVFFTLSGFLITALLLNEWDRNGNLALGAFYLRRARRLAPPIALCLLGILVAVAVLDDLTRAAPLGGDMLATVGYVANWWFIADGAQYGDLFAQPSPLRHMWSLAIEEQFYLVLPLLVIVLGVRGSRRRLAGVLVTAALASAVLSVVLSPSRAYDGTDTRAVELLVGVLASLALHQRGRAAALVQRCSRLAPLGLCTIVAAAMLTTSRSALWHSGGFVVLATATVSVLACALATPNAATSRALSTRPLRAVGTISYGLYVYHWPVFVIATPRRVGLDGWALTVFEWGASLALATVSYVVVERPVRQLPAPRRALPVGFVVASVVTAIVALTAETPENRSDFGVASSSGQVLDCSNAADDGTVECTPVSPETSIASAPTNTSSPTVPPSTDATIITVPVDSTAPTESTSPTTDGAVTTEAPRVLVVGDSTSGGFAAGVQQAVADELSVFLAGVIGCPLVAGVTTLSPVDAVTPTDHCPTPETDWPLWVDTYDIDALVIVVGLTELYDHRSAGSDAITNVLDADFVAQRRQIIGDLVSALPANFPVIVTDLPFQGYGDLDRIVARNRFDAWNAMIDTWADEWNSVHVLRWSQYFAPADSPQDRRERPDGWHAEADAVERMANEGLLDDLLALINR
jgi:peptidoglycan/LPS O-acetylase OafA/YrhL